MTSSAFFCLLAFMLNLSVLMAPKALFAETHSCEQAESNPSIKGLKVTSIDFRGLVKTDSVQLSRFLESNIQEELSFEKLATDLARLQDLGIFSRVSCNIELNEQTAKVLFDVEEKWTTIPIIKFTSGGGVRQQTLGLLDANFLGQAREIGAFVEKLGDAWSGVIWFKDAAIFDPRWSLLVQAWSIHRLRTKYVQEISEVQIKTGFFQSRQKYQIDLAREWSSTWKSTAIFEFNQDQFSDQFLDDEIKLKLMSTGLPPATRASIIGLVNRWGRITADRSLFKGQELEQSVRYYSILGGNSHDFLQNELRWRGFFPLLAQSSLAWQLRMGLSDTNVLQYWYYLGGLDGIRGFRDNRFAGRNFLLGNFELRQNFVVHPSLHLQLVPFIDSVAVSERIEYLDAVDGSSAGVGVRILLPKVYRLVVRLDYAVPIKSKDDERLGLGVQHFF